MFTQDGWEYIDTNPNMFVYFVVRGSVAINRPLKLQYVKSK